MLLALVESVVKVRIKTYKYKTCSYEQKGAAAKRKKAKEEPTVESLTEELNYLREVLESTEDNRQTLIKHKRAKEMALEKALKELSEAKVTIKVLEATGKGSMGVQSS